MIDYRSDLRPPARDIALLYESAWLIRPTKDVDRIARMYEGSNVIWTAWDGQRFVGILRGWTDGAHDGYICDLAVAPEYQKRGIGRELLLRVRKHYGPQHSGFCAPQKSRRSTTDTSAGNWLRTAGPWRVSSEVSR